MPSVQTHSRSRKSNAVSKTTGRAVIVAGTPKQDNPQARPGSSPALSAQERERRVAQAAYFRAEKRGFAPGGELQDWVEAEAEVMFLTGNH
jgi:hypothetical protein